MRAKRVGRLGLRQCLLLGSEEVKSHAGAGEHVLACLGATHAVVLSRRRSSRRSARRCRSRTILACWACDSTRADDNTARMARTSSSRSASVSARCSRRSAVRSSSTVGNTLTTSASTGRDDSQPSSTDLRSLRKLAVDPGTQRVHRHTDAAANADRRQFTRGEEFVHLASADPDGLGRFGGA